MNKQNRSNQTDPNSNSHMHTSYRSSQKDNLNYEYVKDWNIESLVEHNLTHHSTDTKRRFIGNVNFQTPFRSMIEKEASTQNDAFAIWEDAQDCARKLNFLLIAQKASLPTGIHRANACAALQITAAIGYRSHGETLESIGDRVGKHKQVIGRYYKRFEDWSAENCFFQLQTFSPEFVIKICQRKTTSTSPLAEVLDEFRQQLTDLFFDLSEAAELQKEEVYLNESLFKKTGYRLINVYELLKNN